MLFKQASPGRFFLMDQHYVSELFTMIIMAMALGMDAFSVGLGMGSFKLRLRTIALIGITVGIFHVWLPYLGILSGAFLTGKFGTFASFVGAVLLLFLGLQMLLSGLRGKEEAVIAPVGFGLLLFATSVSLDSFSVGLSLGMIGARAFIAIMCFGMTACFMTIAGLLLGRKVHSFMGKYSFVIGGSILFAFGLKILMQLI